MANDFLDFQKILGTGIDPFNNPMLDATMTVKSPIGNPGQGQGGAPSAGGLQLQTGASAAQPQVQGAPQQSAAAQPMVKGLFGNRQMDPNMLGLISFLGQLGGAIGGQGSVAERVGGVASGFAQNALGQLQQQQTMQRFLQSLSGGGGAQGASPFSAAPSGL